MKVYQTVQALPVILLLGNYLVTMETAFRGNSPSVQAQASWLIVLAYVNPGEIVLPGINEDFTMHSILTKEQARSEIH